MKARGRQLTQAALALTLSLAAAPAHALSQAEVDGLVRTIDDRQRNSGDYKALCLIEQRERGRNDLAYEAVVYRRDADDKLMILFMKPRSEAGKGYLRLDKNLFMYDPTVGKWERRTERERIMGTDSRRQDFDESRLADEYTATHVKTEKLGAKDVHQLELRAREGVDVGYPVVRLWVDVAEGNLLKRQDVALSGRLMRTTYYPRWKKLRSESKGADVYFPEEVRIFDEVEKGNQTTVLISKVDLRGLDANIFTKAWLESKSR
jgi:hypothetical protein